MNSKKLKYKNEETNEFKKLIIILVVLCLIILVIYFFTRAFVTKDLTSTKNKETPVTGEINYDTTLIGSMLNKNNEEYYVLISNSKDVEYVYYVGIANSYSNKENALKVYTADLDNELNKNYYDPDHINLNPKNISDFKTGDLSLLKISKGKIMDTYTTKEDITKILTAK